ncbi:MAG: hypothetical protein FWC66_01340 [Oscillospiraceae bacterium]|nr:hypothetical protein [Oscillospiraceae bacterium]
MCKKSMIGVIALLLIISTIPLIASCAAHVGDDGNSAGQNTDSTTMPNEPSENHVSVGMSEMWSVEVLSAEQTESLTTTMAALQYGGGILETTNEVLPQSGYRFLLIGLIVEKTGTGRASFSWNDAHIIDNKGNVFFRHPNDTFLTHLNIPRFRGVDMVFGSEYGYVCFEIPIDSEGLKFIADNGSIVIALNA